VEPDEWDRIWTVTDQCGLSSTVVQRLIVDYPQVTYPQAVTGPCPLDPSPNIWGYALSTDPAYTASYTDYNSYTTDCSPFNGNIYLIIRRTWVVSDLCGNRTDIQLFTVLDKTAPILTVPSDITFNCSQLPDLFPLPGSSLLINATAVDECTGATSVMLSEDRPDRSAVNSGTVPVCSANILNARTTKRTWSATDSCGNTVSSIQTVSFTDKEAPYFIQGGGPKLNFSSITIAKSKICNIDDIKEFIGKLTFNLTLADNCMPVPSEKYVGEFLNTLCTSLTYSWQLSDWCGNVIYDNLTITITEQDLSAASINSWSLFIFLCFWIFHLINVNA